MKKIRKIVMEVIDLLVLIGGIMLATISYFLKKTMEELKEVKNVSSTTREKLLVLESDSKLRNEHLTDKFDVLNASMKDLTNEIKSLNKELFKKKEQ
jgi:hypothetical protein